MTSQSQSSQLHDAHHFQRVTVTYRWHPLYGESLPVCGRKRDRHGEHFFCRLSDDTICLLPAGMFGPRHRESAIGPPVIAIDALATLRELLTAVRAADASGSSLRSAPEDRDEATASTELAVTSPLAEHPGQSDSTRQTRRTRSRTRRAADQGRSRHHTRSARRRRQ